VVCFSLRATMSISVEICLLPSKIASFAANWHGVKTPEQRTVEQFRMIRGGDY